MGNQDITIDAISVIANYRNQFNRVLNNDGYDKLVSLIRQKTQGLQQPDNAAASNYSSARSSAGNARLAKS